jgi:hypothetical protein
MGLLSDLRTLHRQSEEIRAGYDPVAQAHAGIASMRAAREAMESAVSVVDDTRSVPGCATVLRVAATGLQVGDLPVADVDLLVDVDGRPPFPAQVRTGIPLTGAGQAEPGGLVAVRVVGSSVAVLWGVQPAAGGAFGAS